MIVELSRFEKWKNNGLEFESQKLSTYKNERSAPKSKNCKNWKHQNKLI